MQQADKFFMSGMDISGKTSDVMDEKTPAVTEFSFPLKERVRGELSPRVLAAEQQRYIDVLDNIRLSMYALRQSFGTRRYRHDGAVVSLHAWSKAQSKLAVPQLRWRWLSQSNNGKPFVLMLPLAEILADPKKSGHAFVMQFFSDIRGTTLQDKFLETETARVELNLRRHLCRQTALSLEQLLHTVEWRRSFK